MSGIDEGRQDKPCEACFLLYFKMDWFVVARFYRWANRLSQRRSKCLTPDPLKKLMKTGLELFRPPRLSPVKGA